MYKAILMCGFFFAGVNAWMPGVKNHRFQFKMQNIVTERDPATPFLRAEITGELAWLFGHVGTSLRAHSLERFHTTGDSFKRGA